MCVFVHKHNKGSVQAGWLTAVIIIGNSVVITGWISWTSITSLSHFAPSLEHSLCLVKLLVVGRLGSWRGLGGEKVKAVIILSPTQAQHKRMCPLSPLTITHNASGNQPDVHQRGREPALPLERVRDRVFLEDSWT